MPSDMYMKAEYTFLTIIVLGPNNSKQKINVYLQFLIKELTKLWRRVEAFDVMLQPSLGSYWA